jgi:glycolate oxidase FAD binding subunit
MTRLTFKVLPAAASSATLLLAGADRPGLLAALRAAWGTACDVSGAALLPLEATARSAVADVAGAGRALAALRVEGTETSVSYRLGALERLVARKLGLDARRLGREASRALWREIRDVRLIDPALPVLWRVSCPPSEGEAVARAAAPLEPELLLDWSGGLVWVAHGRTGGDAGAEILRHALDGPGGHATLVRGPAELRARIEPFQPQPVLLRGLSQRVKAAFDPKAILNPGRMHAGL